MEEQENQNPNSEIASVFESQQKTSIAWRTSTIEERKERLKEIRNWIQTHHSQIHEALWKDFQNPKTETVDPKSN